MNLLAAATSNTRAFGGCLAVSLAIGMVLDHSRWRGRQFAPGVYWFAKIVQVVFLLAGVIFLFFEPLT